MNIVEQTCYKNLKKAWNCIASHTMSTFVHNGVTVKFPFPPYDIQKDYMRMVIDAIKNKEHAMLESPTGTGKVIIIL